MMPATYNKIATVTVGSGGAANIEFTSIPGTYTDLLVKTSLRCNSASAGADQVLVTLNSSTSSFTGIYLINNAGSVSSANNVERGVTVVNRNGSTTSTFSNGEFYIPNYAGSTNKSISADSTTEQNGTTGYFQVLKAGLWSNSAAITSIKLEDESGHNFVQYSTATLYGIKNS